MLLVSPASNSRIRAVCMLMLCCYRSAWCLGHTCEPANISLYIHSCAFCPPCSFQRRRISTMTRSQTTPLHQSWRLRYHKPAVHESLSAGKTPSSLPELQTQPGLSFPSLAYLRVQIEKSTLHIKEHC